MHTEGRARVWDNESYKIWVNGRRGEDRESSRKNRKTVEGGETGEGGEKGKGRERERVYDNAVIQPNLTLNSPRHYRTIPKYAQILFHQFLPPPRVPLR